MHARSANSTGAPRFTQNGANRISELFKVSSSCFLPFLLLYLVLGDDASSHYPIRLIVQGLSSGYLRPHTPKAPRLLAQTLGKSAPRCGWSITLGRSTTEGSKEILRQVVGGWCRGVSPTRWALHSLFYYSFVYSLLLYLMVVINCDNTGTG